MIRVNRGPAPKGFARRAKRYLLQYSRASKSNPHLTVSTFWNKIRPRLRQDAAHLFDAFHGKCAFCESRMAHVAAPHIEHYRPKHDYPALVFDWNNWLLSCGRCNGIKWSHFPDCLGQPCLIDPVNEDPEFHIEFVRYVPVPKTKRGEETIKLIGLDRVPLEEERSQWLMYINALLLLCREAEFLAEARNLLIWSMQEDAPYAATTRCYLRLKAPRLANPVRPHPNILPTDPITRVHQLLANQIAHLDHLT